MASATDREWGSLPAEHLDRLRAILLALGATGLAVGLTVLVLLENGPGPSSGPITDLVGNDWVVVGVVGAAALFVAIATVGARLRDDRRRARPPHPEGVHGVDHVGSALDEFHDGGGIEAWRAADEAIETVHERLRAAAIDTVMRETDCTRSEARGRVESGIWTDDEAAASFLADPPEPTHADRLRAALGLQSTYQRAARATAEEIVGHDPEVQR